MPFLTGKIIFPRCRKHHRPRTASRGRDDSSICLWVVMKRATGKQGMSGRLESEVWKMCFEPTCLDQNKQLFNSWLSSRLDPPWLCMSQLATANIRNGVSWCLHVAVLGRWWLSWWINKNSHLWNAMVNIFEQMVNILELPVFSKSWAFLIFPPN